jgi:hypothetical protein
MFGVICNEIVGLDMSRVTRYVLFATYVGIGGCSLNYGTFSVLGTRPVDVSNQSFERVREGVTGKSVRPTYVIFPTGYPRIGEAVEDALTSTGGDLMTNAKVSLRWWYIPFLYGETYFEVTGDTWKAQHESAVRAALSPNKQLEPTQ